MTAATPEKATPEDRSPAQFLIRRWPTILALTLSIVGVIAGGSGDVDGSVEAFGEALPLLPLLYLIVHQLGKPRLTWPALGVGLVLMVALRAQDLVSQSETLIALALAFLVFGALRGTPHGRTVFRIQTVGALVFCALAVLGLVLDPEVGRWLVAAGWFFHGVWDFAHLRLDRLDGIVSRTFAEWCGVIDVCVAVQLVFLP